VKFTPRPYQRLIAEHILKHPRCGVWAGMGMGKTAATLFALNILRYLNDNPTLIIAPLRVATSVWPAEARKWDDFKDIDIVPITGSVAERRRALQIPADFHTINYDNLPWLVDEVGGPEGWRWKTVVADESTRLKSFRLGGHGGQRARALSKVSFGSDAVADLFDKKKEGKLSDVKRFAYIERFIELTGTPSPNGLLDLWGPLWFLDKGAAVLLLHHTNKASRSGEGAGVQAYRGGSAAYDSCRFAFYLRASTPKELEAQGIDAGDPNGYLILENTKNNYLPICPTLMLERRGYCFYARALRSKEDKADEAKAEAYAVQEVMRGIEKPAPRQEIETAVHAEKGREWGSVNKNLRLLEAEGLVEKTKAGQRYQYAVTAKGRNFNIRQDLRDE